MQRACALLPALALLAWPAGADARQFPTRAEIERALDRHEACGGRGNLACFPALHYRIRRNRCFDLEDPYQPGRILCRYTSTVSGRGGPPIVAPQDCAYLKRDANGRWRIDAYPDADMCGE